MNFLPKSDSASKDHEELDLPAVRLFAVSEKSELNMDDTDQLKADDTTKSTVAKTGDDPVS